VRAEKGEEVAVVVRVVVVVVVVAVVVVEVVATVEVVVTAAAVAAVVAAAMAAVVVVAGRSGACVQVRPWRPCMRADLPVVGVVLGLELLEPRLNVGLLETMQRHVAINAHMAHRNRHEPVGVVDREHAASRPRTHVLAEAEEAAAGGHEVACVLEEMEADDVGREHAWRGRGAERCAGAVRGERVSRRRGRAWCVVRAVGAGHG
jgi:hypothetical protein